MANQLKCNFCSNPATVHFTQIINNKVHKIDLCETCAQAKGVTDPGGFSLSDLLIKGAGTTGDTPSLEATGLHCEQCGFTQADFKKRGRFGCPHCYETFKHMLTPMLEDMHKGTTHTGKVPRYAAARKTYHDRISKLELTLADAIKAERYEDAARYRDEITQVKQAFGTPDTTS